jgi:hypothetical protein
MPKFLGSAFLWTGAPITTTAIIRKLLPPDKIYQQIIGMKFYNRSLFDVLMLGFPGIESFNLEPFSEMYIPNTSQVELTITSVMTAIATLNDILNPFMSTQEGSSIDILVFFAGDAEPTEAYIPVFRSQNVIVAAPINLQDVNATFSVLVSAGSSSSNVLSVASANPGHLWLTQASIQFGVPGTAGGGEATLTAGDGTQYEIWHFNLGLAPMGPWMQWVNYVNPLKVAVVSGNAKFTFAVPAVTSGPGYSVNLKGYFFQA